MVVSTKGPEGYSFANPITYDYLNAAVQNCLSTTYSAELDAACTVDVYGPYDWDGLNDEVFHYYWETNCFVAKLDEVDGAVRWKTAFDADDNDPGCYPEDMRNQECVYRITEMPDGALVISGNTSHNLDDNYLAKLHADCQSQVTYDQVIYEAVAGSEDHSYSLPFDETWAADKNIVGTIVIPDGLTLTISNCTIRFADSQQLAWPTRIVVEQGGALILDHATLTSLDQCPNSMWDGVQVLGNYFAGQSLAEQGYVNMKSSTIENARTALLTAQGDPGDPLGPIVKESTGGWIQASDAIFRNNIYDAVFRPYENRDSNAEVLANLSSFMRCTFITDGGPPVETLHPVDHVAMLGVRGIRYLGCTWSNTLLGPALDNSTQQGVGISSMKSSFIVGDDCTAIVNVGEPCPLANLTTSSFTNLHRGVVVTTFDPSRTFSVDHASFTGCNGGIRMEGVQDPAITRNSFDIAEPFVTGLLGSTYGVYSDQCTGYSLQENSFTTSQPEGVQKVGVIIKDSGGAPNLVYNNTFDNLYAGTIVQGQNRNETIGDEHIGEGVEIRCNDYGQQVDINKFDVALTGSNPTIAKQQGRIAVAFPLDPPDPTKPAGNVFSDNCATNSLGDYSVQLPSAVIEYWHHTSLLVHVEPQCFNYILLSDALATWPGKNQACPSHLNEGHIIKRLNAQEGKEGYEEANDAYVATKDDGDSEALLAYIGNPSHSSGAKRNAMLAVAPNASAQVFEAALSATPAMSAWHLTQALVANSPLQGAVLYMVEGSDLDPYYIGLVQGAQNGEVSLLSVLEAEKAAYQQQKQQALYGLGREAWFDSTGTGLLDSLLLWTDLYDAMHAPLAKAGAYGAKGDYAAVEALATAAQVNGPDADLYAVVKLWAQAEQGQGWEQLVASAAEQLAGLAQQRDLIGSAQANAWLHALGGELPEEIIILPVEEEAKRALVKEPVLAPLFTSPYQFEAFPNPTSDAQWITYLTPVGASSAQLMVRDMLGRDMLQQRLIPGASGITELNVGSWPCGIYSAALLADGITLATMKLVVQH